MSNMIKWRLLADTEVFKAGDIVYSADVPHDRKPDIYCTSFSRERDAEGYYPNDLVNGSILEHTAYTKKEMDAMNWADPSYRRIAQLAKRRRKF